MVDCCDLYALLSKIQNRSLRGIGVYCFVTREIQKPSAFSRNTTLQEGGKFVEAEVFALDLKSIRNVLATNGVISESDRFLVNASLSIYVDANIPVQDWYFFQGTLMMNSATSRIPLCTLINSKKVGSNFVLNKISASDFEISHFEGTYRQMGILNMSINSGCIVHPDDVNRFPRLYAEIPDRFVSSNPQILKTGGLCADQMSHVETNVPKELIQPAVAQETGYSVPVEQSVGLQKRSAGNQKFKKESRERIKDKPAVFDEMQDWLKESSKIQKEYVQSLRSSYPADEDHEKVASLLGNVRRNWKSRVGGAMTGKALLKGYLDKSGEDLEQEYMGESLLDYLLDIKDELIDFCLYGSPVTADGEPLSIIKNLFSSPDVVYAGLVSQFMGTGYDKSVNMAKQLLKYGVSYSKIFESNPYLFTICGLDMNFATSENIAYAMGIWSKKDIQSSRNIAILSDYMLYSDTQDTNYSVESIKSATLGVRLTKNALDKLKLGNSILSAVCSRNVNAYFDVTETPYPKSGWKYDGGYYYLALGVTDIESAIKDAEQVGMIIRKNVCGTEMLLCTTFLQMELYILNKCYKLTEKPCRFNDINRINKLIDDYEGMKGFKLEQAQRQGVITSVTNNVSAISGPAGSGKTTTSDCLVYVYSHYYDDEFEDEGGADEEGEGGYGLDVDDIQYAAPTGKAAKRLQEVVGRPVSTMHSKFKVGIGERTVLDTDEEDDYVSEGGATVYIFDEVAMCNLRLLYTVLSRTGNAIIVFLGDICQLSPIGKGLPFRDLLKFIPCTFLLVSKRSLEGSGLTLNSTLINDCSEPDNFKYLQESDDFKLVSCSDDDIANKIYTICGYHLGKVTKDKAEGICGCSMIDTNEIKSIKPDDIQVVMPISTDKYPWGASVVNARLQDLFNPKSSSTKEFKIQNFGKDRVLRVGDRVIHTNSNMYTMQWYESFDGTNFQMAWGSGIMNGDVGKVVDIVEAKKRLKFLSPEGEPPEGYEEPKHKIRKDKSWRGEDHYFVVVEYYDYGSGKNYYILYQALVDGYARGSGLYLTGEDLSFLDLSYALTTHKMQGSQNKLIIYGLGKVRRQGFVTRNAVYTGETRAGRGEYMVGSVDDTMTSQLNVARQIVEQEGVSTVLGDVWDMQ